MKTTHDHSIFSKEFQAVLAPSQQVEIESLQQEAQEWKEKYHHLLEQLRLAKQQRFGRSSEAHPGQGELQFDEAESVETNELPKEENTISVTYTRKKPVRRPLPEHLPREVIEHARNNHYTALQRYELRLQQAKPILEELKIWLDKTIKTTSTQSELGKALDYMHLRWGELTAYLLDGCLEIDNNLIENLIRPFALGRKNWLVAGSPRGAHAGALFYSLIATAKANGLNPFGVCQGK